MISAAVMYSTQNALFAIVLYTNNLFYQINNTYNPVRDFFLGRVFNGKIGDLLFCGNECGGSPWRCETSLGK